MTLSRRWLGQPATRDRILLAAVSLALLVLPGGATTLWNRHEGRFVAAAWDMVHTCDWVIPRNDGAPVVFYPPLLTWLIVVFSHLLGGLTEFAARLPAALGSAGCVLVSYELGRDMFDRRTGLFAGLALMAIPVWQRWSCACQPDSLMTFFVMLGLWAVWRARGEEAPRWRWTILLGVATGLAVLPKGPVGVVLIAVVVGSFLAVELWPVARRDGAAAILSRNGPAGVLWKLRPAAVLVVALAIGAPWFVLAWKVAGAGYVRSLWQETSDMATGGEMLMHQAPVHYYLPRFIGPAFPWSAFFIAALIPVASAHDRRGERSARAFLCAWIVSLLVLFSAAQGKRVYYMIPLLPPLAILAASWWTRPPALSRAPLARIREWGPWSALLAVAIAGVVAAPFVPAEAAERLKLGGALVPTAVAGVLVAAGLLWLHFTKGSGASFAGLAGTLLLVMGLHANFGLRSSDMDGRQAVAFCRKVNERVPPTDDLVLEGVLSPAAYYLGRDVLYGSGEAEDHATGRSPRWLLVDEGMWRKNKHREQERFAIVDNPGLEEDNMLLCRRKAIP